MRFLVTGATGFIGSNLVNALVAAHGANAITVLTHDESNKRELERLDTIHGLGVQLVRGDLMALRPGSMAVPAFDVVYHLVAYTETETPSARMAVNDVGTRNLLEWLGGSLAGKRLIYTGTLASVDRSCPSGPLDEATQCAPKTVYGRGKLAAEAAIRSGRTRFGYDYTILRVCTVMGHGCRPGGMFGVFPQMLARGAWAARLNWPGRSSFITVTDLVKILLAVPGISTTANELYVTSSGEDPSFDKLLEQMAAVLEIPREKITLPPWIWSLAWHAVWLGSASSPDISHWDSRSWNRTRHRPFWGGEGAGHDRSLTHWPLRCIFPADGRAPAARTPSWLRLGPGAGPFSPAEPDTTAARRARRALARARTRPGARGGGAPRLRRGRPACTAAAGSCRRWLAPAPCP